MCRDVFFNQFRHLQTIVSALEEFYKNDRNLLMPTKHTHEQTVSFRVGMYLANRLEDKSANMYVDCEYHGDINNPSFRKVINGRRVRPDIIFHDRNQKNEFCIEIKLHSVGHDATKINGYISNYNYREGYCIYNIGINFVTILAFSSGTPCTGIKYRYRFKENTQHLEPCM